MLKGDIGLLAKECGVSKSTIYRVAEKIDLDLTPLRGRCDKTVDYISGTSLKDEQKIWLDIAVKKIKAFRQAKIDQREHDREEERRYQERRKAA